MTHPWKCFCLNILGAVLGATVILGIAFLIWQSLFPDWRPDLFEQLLMCIGAAAIALNLGSEVCQATRNLLRRLRDFA